MFASTTLFWLALNFVLVFNTLYCLTSIVTHHLLWSLSWWCHLLSRLKFLCCRSSTGVWRMITTINGSSSTICQLLDPKPLSYMSSCPGRVCSQRRVGTLLRHLHPIFGFISKSPPRLTTLNNNAFWILLSVWIKNTMCLESTTSSLDCKTRCSFLKLDFEHRNQIIKSLFEEVLWLLPLLLVLLIVLVTFIHGIRWIVTESCETSFCKRKEPSD